jgi:hypothetical protein
MHYGRRGFFIIMLSIVLFALPCLGGTPQPTDSSTMPDFHPTHLPDITVDPITYQGPTLSDIGMKLIAYEGPELGDITVDPIQYTHHIISPVQQPAIKQVGASSAKPKAINLVPQPIPGAQPGLRILSPMPGQTFSGSVPLEVEITGWQGVPPVNLAWWWSPSTAAGKWPATPQGMAVVDRLDGKTRITIPRSAFPKSGLWRLEASVRVSDHQRVVDDVSFTLAGMLQPTNTSGPPKVAPKTMTPVTTPNQTTTSSRVPARPTPIRPQVEPQ